MHVDLDAFYAVVEQRDHPERRGLPGIPVPDDPPDAKAKQREAA